MMGDGFLAVRTTSGEKRLLNVRHITMIQPVLEDRIKISRQDNLDFEVVATMVEMENALALFGIVIVAPHDFTFEDQEKEGAEEG